MTRQSSCPAIFPRLIVLALCATLGGPLVAEAQTRSGEPLVIEHSESQERTQSAQETTNRMAIEYAKSYQVTFQEAKRRMERQNSLGDDIERLRKIEGDRVAGWGIDHRKNYIGWVKLKGNQPGSREGQEFSEGIVDLELRVGATHSFKELVKVNDELFYDSNPNRRLSDRTLETVTGSSIDLDNNAIMISVQPGKRETITRETLSRYNHFQYESAVTDSTRGVAKRILTYEGVRINIIEEPATTNATKYRGGLPIDRGNCTAGFSMKRQVGSSYDDYIVGYLTSGHCGRGLTIRGKRVTTNLRFNDRARDWQFVVPDLTLKDSASADFKCGRGITYCSVTGTTTQYRMKDDFVCHYGSSSGYSCGTVVYNYFAPHPTCPGGRCSGNNWVLVRGPKLAACGGDSGGPFFSGTTAYGILDTVGSSTGCRPGNTSATFYPINRIEQSNHKLKLRRTIESKRGIQVTRINRSTVFCGAEDDGNFLHYVVATVDGYEYGEPLYHKIVRQSGGRGWNDPHLGWDWSSVPYGFIESQRKKLWVHQTGDCNDGDVTAAVRGLWSGRTKSFRFKVFDTRPIPGF